jgi:hypothetical protein
MPWSWTSRQRDRVLAVRRDVDLMPPALEKLPQCLAAVRVVVNDEDASAHWPRASLRPWETQRQPFVRLSCVTSQTMTVSFTVFPYRST